MSHGRDDRVIPVSAISNPEVAAYAEEAAAFLKSHRWCAGINPAKLAWATAGVLGVFLFEITPASPNVDETLWVVVGDIPSAYLVCDDDAPTWWEALDGYVYEMRRWVQAGQSLDGIIPVRVAATKEHAEMLAGRLDFIANEIVARKGDLQSDS